LRLADGRDVFPRIPEAELDELVGPLSWRLVQEAPGRLVVVVEAEAAERAADAISGIREVVAQAFGPGFSVTLSTSEARPGGMARRKRELLRSMLAA
jgi:hypothetical protein